MIIDSAGLVLTQYLAVHEGDQHTVTTIDGKTYPATIKAADPRSGLAVLAIDHPGEPASASGRLSKSLPTQSTGSFPAIRLRRRRRSSARANSSSRSAIPYAIRSDGQPTASWGIVTNLARKAPAGTNLNDAPGPAGDYRTTLHHLGTLIQTDAKLGWSTGGGALVNLRGELVGLTTTAATIAGHEQPAGYAIPINATFRRIIDTLKEGREVEYGMLGVSFRPTDLLTGPAATQRDPEGVTVLQVYPGSPAARAGLEQGDVVTHVAGRKVDDVDRRAVGGQHAAASHDNGDRIPPRRSCDDQPRRRSPSWACRAKKSCTDRPPSWRGIRVDYATALDAATLAEPMTSGALDPEGCVLVTEVETDSPAWQAGVRPGMFISHVGPDRVTTPDEFRAAVAAASGEVSIRLTQPVRQADQRETADLQIP